MIAAPPTGEGLLWPRRPSLYPAGGAVLPLLEPFQHLVSSVLGGFRTLVNVPHLSVCLPCVTLLQNSANMPEVRELSEALSEMSMDPITGVGVVASRNRAPTGYDVVRSR